MAKRKAYTLSDYSQVMKQPKTLHNTIVTEDNTLFYDFMTPLQKISGAKIITNLWMNQSNKLVTFFSCDTCENKISDLWKIIESDVVTQVSDLFLPDPLTKKLENIVPLIGNTLLNWIRYQDKFIFNSVGYFAVHHINNITWTARGRIDYAQTAINILSNQHNTLSDDHKYKLACTYCLENEIDVLAPYVVNQNYIRSINIDTHTMVCFWTAKLTGDDRILPPLSHYANRGCKISRNEAIFRILLRDDGSEVKRTCNEVAIRFIWNELNDEEKAKNIVSFIKVLGNQDLRYSVLSCLNYFYQCVVFSECSGFILGDIFNDWLWGENFMQTALHISYRMDPLSYLDILNKITKELINNYDKGNKCIYDRYKSIFKKLWLDVGPRFVRDDILRFMDGYLLRRLVTSSLSCERDMDIIDLIFKGQNTEEKENPSMEYYIRPKIGFQRERWDLVKVFIQYTHFPSIKKGTIVWYLTRRLIEDTRVKVAFYFFVQGSSAEIEHFLNWAFPSKEEIDEFKLSLSNFDTLLESIIVNNTDELSKAETHYKRCAVADIGVKNQFKAEFLTSVSGKYLMIKLIRQEKYQLLDQVLNWCLLDNKQRIIQFKSNLHKDEYFLHDLNEVLNEMEPENYHKFNKFIDWSFTNEQEAQEFKSSLTYYRFPESTYLHAGKLSSMYNIFVLQLCIIFKIYKNYCIFTVRFFLWNTRKLIN